MASAAVQSAARPGTIPATPYVVGLWPSLFPQLDTDEKTGAMLSPNGNLIVSGTGYLGASPPNVVDATHAVQWAYATDLAVVHRSDRPSIFPETLHEALNRTTNTVTYRATRPYAIAWSGLLHAAVLVAVTPSASGAVPPGTAVTAHHPREPPPSPRPCPAWPPRPPT